MRRDRLTFAMMVGMPIMQLILFGFAINTDPKQLPTAVVARRPQRLPRSLVAALENSAYFRIVRRTDERAKATRLLATATVQFVVRSCRATSRASCCAARGPSAAGQADATDPAATGNALAALQQLATRALARDLDRPAGRLQPASRRPSRSACSAATTRRA